MGCVAARPNCLFLSNDWTVMARIAIVASSPKRHQILADIFFLLQEMALCWQRQERRVMIRRLPPPAGIIRIHFEGTVCRDQLNGCEISSFAAGAAVLLPHQKKERKKERRAVPAKSTMQIRLSFLIVTNSFFFLLLLPSFETRFAFVSTLESFSCLSQQSAMQVDRLVFFFFFFSLLGFYSALIPLLIPCDGCATCACFQTLYLSIVSLSLSRS